MNWLNASLPIWIIGAPVLYAVFDWISAPKSTSLVSTGVEMRRVPLPA